MFVNFFIDRPIFSAVVSIVITLTGVLTLAILPVAQFPQIAPPQVTVDATYPGASAQDVEQAVTIPLEQQINGVEHMLYLSSVSSNDGRATITVTFEIGTDVDLAAVDVQNRVAMATSQLPEVVTRQGVTTRKQATSLMMVAALSSPNQEYDAVFLSNYASIQLTEVLRREEGVGNVEILGALDYGMRIWLNPDKMARLGITTSDVAEAVQEQNAQMPAGQIGQPPAPSGQQYQYTVRTRGRLTEPGEFEDIILRAQPNGSIVRIRDVAEVELGSQTYSSFGRLNGSPGTLIGIYQRPGANALDVAARVKNTLAGLSKTFPKGVEYHIPYDTTLFVEASIKEVLQTLLIAVILVVFTVYLFLQDWRATLIPSLTIPVALIGSLAVFGLAGFSINTLTLFGLVLAIGIVVDDAIVIVEATKRHLDESDIAPKEAAKRAMGEVTAPVIATSLVLLAMFVPIAFWGGLTGELYRQFALTISVAVALSTVNAVTLSPALCGVLLSRSASSSGGLRWAFGRFNSLLDRLTQSYSRWVETLIRRTVIVLLLFLVLFGGTYALFEVVPTGFVPPEDQGAFFVNIQLPDAAALERTRAVTDEVEGILKSIPGVQDVVTIGGLSLVTRTYASNNASVIGILTPWEQRTSADLELSAILGQVRRKLASVNQAIVMAFNPPAIPGLGTVGGFQFELQDRSGGRLSPLADAGQQLAQAAMQRPEFAGLSSSFRADVPQVSLELDRLKAKVLGVPLNELSATLQAFLGSLYINDITKFGRTYEVLIQAQPQFRSSPEDIDALYVRGTTGHMVPLSTLAQTSTTTGPETISRYNLFRTAEINGQAAPGYSSSQAMSALADLADKILPEGMGYEWTGMSYQEIEAGSQAPLVFTMALVFAFLFLAAQYESWMIPFAVLLAVPPAVFGAMSAQWLRGFDNNVYAQLGFVMLIGLSAKAAILIVEYAQVLREEGRSIQEAAVEAARIRFRPILMTSFSTIFGLMPLVIVGGAGAASRQSLGTSVLGGMVASTILGLLFVPVLFVVIQRLRERGRSDSKTTQAENRPERPASDSPNVAALTTAGARMEVSRD